MVDSGLRIATDEDVTAHTSGRHNVFTINTLDVSLSKAMLKLWIEMVVHATASMQNITGEAEILPREQVRVEEDGSLIFEISMPMNHGEVRMKVPMGKWTYRKPVN